MARVDVVDKARRYLRDGRVTVVSLTPETSATVEVEGTRDVPYQVNWTPTHGWRCSCPARGRCAHVVACEMVVDPARPVLSMPPVPPPPDEEPGPTVVEAADGTVWHTEVTNHSDHPEPVLNLSALAD